MNIEKTIFHNYVNWEFETKRRQNVTWAVIWRVMTGDMLSQKATSRAQWRASFSWEIGRDRFLGWWLVEMGVGRSEVSPSSRAIFCGGIYFLFNPILCIPYSCCFRAEVLGVTSKLHLLTPTIGLTKSLKDCGVFYVLFCGAVVMFLTLFAFTFASQFGSRHC